MKVLTTIAFSYLISLVLILFILLMGPRAYSAPVKASSCRALIEEMIQMKKAQNQIIVALAQNHDVFADQLSDLSFELALYKKTVPNKALQAMDKSAQAYRIRSSKAQESAQRLDDLTSGLIEKAQGCLK